MIKKFLPCRTCAAKPGPLPGFYYSPDRKSVIECTCHKEWSRKTAISRKLIQSNLWDDLHYNPDTDYKGTKSLDSLECLQNYVKDFHKNPEYQRAMIYMYGTNGTQKTTLAMWVGVSLVQQGYTVFYTLMESLVAALTPDFDKENPNRQRYIEKAMTADLLIIDEAFDRSKVTLYKSGYQIPYLDRALRERFDVYKRGILFISNQPANSIEASGFGPSLESLVARNTASASLVFEDVYIKLANDINPKGLFNTK